MSYVDLVSHLASGRERERERGMCAVKNTFIWFSLSLEDHKQQVCMSMPLSREYSYIILTLHETHVALSSSCAVKIHS